MNLQRMGVQNTVITKMEGRWFKTPFDKILLDAPCSGSGLIKGETKRSLDTLKMWNPNYIKSMGRAQKKMISHAFSLLKDNGTLIYSTCSLEPEENEKVVDSLLNKFENAKLEKIDLKIKSELNLDYGDYSSELKKCIKLWPQFYDSEGFFIAKFKLLEEIKEK